MANGVAAVSFNTHAVVKQLIAAKFTEQQAEPVCNVMQDLQSSATSGFSTKQDILDLRKDAKQDILNLRHEIQDLRKDMESKFDKLTLQLTIRLGLMVVAGFCAFSVLFKYLLMSGTDIH